MKSKVINKGIWTGLLIIILLIITIFSTGKYGIVIIFVMLGLSFLTTLYSIISSLVSITRTRLTQQSNSISYFKLIAKFILLFLISGTFLYVLSFITIARDSTYFEVPVFFSNAELFIRSLICSFDLFLLNIDSNIIDRLDTHPDLKTWIFIQAILSSLCTAVMLLSLIINRLKAQWQLRAASSLSEQKSHLYLFFGLNTPTELLSADIIAKDPKSMVILIDEANIDDNATGTWENIISYFGHKSSSFSFASRTKTLIAVANTGLNKIGGQTKDGTDILLEVGLSKIKSIIQGLTKVKSDDTELHIFFMGDEEDKNIADLLVIAKDSTILNLPKDKVRTTLYCHARKSGPATFLNEIGVLKQLNIKVVDSSAISVEYLKLHEEFHPVNQVELSSTNKGSVSSSLKTLIIGFGEVGRDSLRFLYEFGALLDESSPADNAIKIPFECTVVDPAMKDLEGGFINSAPMLFKDNSGITLINISANQKEFYEQILNEENCKELNYIVICTGDDDLNIDLSLKIFRQLRNKCNSMKRVKILIRCNSSEKKLLMDKYINFYNLCQFNEENQEELLENPSSDIDKKEKTNPILQIFGYPESIYTFELIIGNQIENEAKEFFKRYQQQSNGKLTWENRRNKLTAAPLTLDHLNELHRKEGQDIENALHSATKIHILKKSLGENYDWGSFTKRYFKSNGLPNQTGHFSSINYPELSKDENNLILNLAKLEHLRWVASMELSGYSLCKDGENSCNEKLKTHNCLVDWKELDRVSSEASQSGYPIDYKLYDFYVVDTTISLNYEQ